MPFPVAILFMNEIPQGHTAGSFSALANNSNCSVCNGHRWNLNALHRHVLITNYAAAVLSSYFAIGHGDNAIIVDGSSINVLTIIGIAEHLKKIVWIKDIKTANFLNNLSDLLSEDELIDTQNNIFYGVAEAHGIVSAEEARSREGVIQSDENSLKEGQLIKEKLDSLLSANSYAI